MEEFNVPIALFNFNRPELTRRIYEVIRQIKPKHLLLVVDGPRASKPDDIRLCSEVRAVFDEIDWECEVHRNFSEKNLGSFRRNSSGLNWVFEQVEEAIILEDDCLPSFSFFPYCKEMLERYRNDQRIGVISGNNFVPVSSKRQDASYYFSTYALTWGWATWRRVWQQVDLDMSWWKQDEVRELLKTLYPRQDEWEYWYKIYEDIHIGSKKNAWDYQLILSSFRNSQLCVIPSINLVSNIGHGVDATNCLDEFSPLSNQPIGHMKFPLKHPVVVWRSEQTDYAIFKTRFDNYTQPTLRQRLLGLVIRKTGSILPDLWKSNLKKWRRNHTTTGRP